MNDILYDNILPRIYNFASVRGIANYGIASNGVILMKFDVTE